MKKSKIQSIKEKYKAVKSKGEFLLSFTEIADRSFNTLRNHWFCNAWLIPEDVQDKAITELDKWIKKESIENVEVA